MFDALNHIAVILIFGGLLLLSFLKLCNPLRINVRANRWLSLFLLLFASFWMEEILSFANIKSHSLFGITLIHGIQGATPFSFYLSVWHYTNPTFRFKKEHLLHLILPIAYIVLFFIQSYFLSDANWVSITLLVIILMQSLYYSIASYVLLQKHQQNILQFVSDKNDYSLAWLKNIIVQVMLISVVIIVYSMMVKAEQLNLFANSLLLFTVYFIAYYSLKQKELFPIKESQKSEIEFIVHDEESVVNEKRKLLPDNDFASLKNRLVTLMEEETLFLDNELNLVKLAERLNLTPHQLSYLINEGFNENFFGFINGYRVSRAKELLKNESQEKQTMLSIAFDAGFNSKTAFNTTFKKMTGLTPTQYRIEQKS